MERARKGYCVTIVTGVAALVCGLFIIGLGAATATDNTLTIVRRDGVRLNFNVVYARDAASRARGLMFRKHLPSMQGMVFDFEHEQIVSMWMKNTYVALAMLFVDSGGIVRSIVARAAPESTAVLSSSVPVRYVVEINASDAAQLEIAIGDHVYGAALP